MTLTTDAAYAVAENVDPNDVGRLIDTCGEIAGQLIPITQWVLDNLLGILQAIRGLLGV